MTPGTVAALRVLRRGAVRANLDLQITLVCGTGVQREKWSLSESWCTGLYGEWPVWAYVSMCTCVYMSVYVPVCSLNPPTTDGVSFTVHAFQRGGGESKGWLTHLP